MPVYLETYPIECLRDDAPTRFSGIVLHLAISGLIWHRFMGHDPAAAMSTLLASPDSTIAQWFSMCRVKMAATAVRTHNAHWVRLTVGFGQLNSLTVAVLL